MLEKNEGEENGMKRKNRNTVKDAELDEKYLGFLNLEKKYI